MTPPARSPSAEALRPFISLPLSFLVWSITFLLATAFYPLLNPLSGNVTKFLSRMIFGAVCFATVYLIVRTKLSKRALAVMIAISAAAMLFGWFLALTPPVRLVVGFAQLLMAASIGVLVCRVVERKEYLIPAAIIASVADFWSVGLGPSKQLVKVEAVVRTVMVHFPQPGTRELAPPASMVDFVFVAFFLAACVRFDLLLGRTLIAMMAAFWLGLGVASWLHLPIPGIPFVAVGFIIVNFAQVRPNRSEIVKTLVVAAILGIAFVLLGCLF